VAIEFYCPQCGLETLVEEEFAGQSGPCRGCGSAVTVPLLLLDQDLPPVEEEEEIVCPPPPEPNPIAAIATVALIAFTVAALIMMAQPSRELSHSRFRESDIPRMASLQLMNIWTALRSYDDVYGSLPRAYWVDSRGNRSHSWREELLMKSWPKAGGFHLVTATPNDDLRAKELQEESGFCFHSFDDRDSPRPNTSFMVITGPGTMFEEGRDLSLKDCADDPSTTILVVEVRNSGVLWSEPADIDIRDLIWKINASDNKGLGCARGDGAHVLFADGRVRFLKNDTLESTLRAMVTRNGGEEVDLSEVP
jgi:prepilin-type processing-associated H-X9-DG protein